MRNVVRHQIRNITLHLGVLNVTKTYISISLEIRQRNREWFCKKYNKTYIYPKLRLFIKLLGNGKVLVVAKINCNAPNHSLQYSLSRGISPCELRMQC